MVSRPRLSREKLRMMVLGAVLYVSHLSMHHWQGLGWVLLNSVIAVGDRLMQRLLLSKDQQPVDISKSHLIAQHEVAEAPHILQGSLSPHVFFSPDLCVGFFLRRDPAAASSSSSTH